MATLKDVQFALNGEPKEGEVPSIPHTPEAYASMTVNEPNTTQWHIFKLKNNNRKGGVYIPNIDDVVNPKTGKVERIRLLSGVDSIWVKDQKDLTKEYIQQNGRSLQFPRGVKILRIAGHDSAALEFARLCNANVGNPRRVSSSKFEFYEYDPAKEEREALEKEELEIEMAILAKQAAPEAMRKHAAFLGIRMINDLGIPKGDDGVRREYVIYAKRNPSYFKSTLGTPQVEISWLVKSAIMSSKIEIGREPGKIFWANGGGMIGVCPSTIPPDKYLTDLAMTNTDEGQKFKEQLQRLGN